jgi:hypothetical protein
MRWPNGRSPGLRSSSRRSHPLSSPPRRVQLRRHRHGRSPRRLRLAAPGATVQLGAFSSQAAANNAWRALSGRFRYLAPLGHSVIPVQAGGRTLYRLRANGPDAAGICRRLQIAGEDCTPVG